MTGVPLFCLGVFTLLAAYFESRRFLAIRQSEDEEWAEHRAEIAFLDGLADGYLNLRPRTSVIGEPYFEGWTQGQLDAADDQKELTP